MSKTRKINIKRIEKYIDEKGNEAARYRWFRVSVNSAVPPGHRMLH